MQNMIEPGSETDRPDASSSARALQSSRCECAAGEQAGSQETDLEGEMGGQRLGDTVDSLLVGTRSRLEERGCV